MPIYVRWPWKIKISAHMLRAALRPAMLRDWPGSLR